MYEQYRLTYTHSDSRAMLLDSIFADPDLAVSWQTKSETIHSPNQAKRIIEFIDPNPKYTAAGEAEELLGYLEREGFDCEKACAKLDLV